jgi:aminoglycoside phosphotransferase (APT) family kinase protein
VSEEEAQSQPPLGIEEKCVSAWMAAACGAQSPLRFTRVVGGFSNMTYLVDDAAGERFVLRRPPLGERLASAHDMGREWRVLVALFGSPVPVPEPLGFCEDEAVTGAPFYVMRFVDGLVLRNPEEVSGNFTRAQRRAIGLLAADVLAEVHALEPAAVGLGELGRPDSYVERQLRRWSRQWEQSKTRELPELEAVAAALGERIPEQGQAAIVHGDYRLDNLIVRPSGEIAAVLDWELCTLGDPLADVGLLLAYWREPGDSYSLLLDSPTFAPGFPTREQLVARYAERTGRDLGGIDYYFALALWKLAVIFEGIHARTLAGGYGDADADLDRYRSSVEELAQAASAKVATLP